MAVTTPPFFLQAGSHAAKTFRRMLAALVGQPMHDFNPVHNGTDAEPGHGVIGAADLAVTANGTPNMTVNVAAGYALITGSAALGQGVYSFANDATVNLAIAAADGVNPRRDIVVAQVRDNTEDGSGQNDARLFVVTGTPAGVPVDPAIPANCLVLARVAVGAGVSSITSGNITDLRVRAASLASMRTDLDVAIAAGAPIGAIVMYGGTTSPSASWLLAQGQLVDKAAYPTLYARYGTIYGSETGSQFRLPDLRQRVPVGHQSGGPTYSDTLGETGGTKDAVVVSHDHPSHSHSVNGSTAEQSATGFEVPRRYAAYGTALYGVPFDPNADGTVIASGGTGAGSTSFGSCMAIDVGSTAIHSHTMNFGSGGATAGATGVSGTDQNLQPYIVLNFLVRAL